MCLDYLLAVLVFADSNDWVFVLLAVLAWRVR